MSKSAIELGMFFGFVDFIENGECYDVFIHVGKISRRSKKKQ